MPGVDHVAAKDQALAACREMLSLNPAQFVLVCVGSEGEAYATSFGAPDMLVPALVATTLTVCEGAGETVADLDE